MLFSFLVTLREGIEIALVVTILLGYLRNIDQKQHFRQIWIGVVAAALLSLGVGVGLEVTSRELSGRVLEAFEGFTMLFAVAGGSTEPTVGPELPFEKKIRKSLWFHA